MNTASLLTLLQEAREDEEGEEVRRRWLPWLRAFRPRYSWLLAVRLTPATITAYETHLLIVSLAMCFGSNIPSRKRTQIGLSGFW
ncbi:hypothetical protein OH77DRAFT_1419234 [Trametes cingulata]|nr:hypothetical protein OH77DRAFT_1419234 [Trametes cingulata]